MDNLPNASASFLKLSSRIFLVVASVKEEKLSTNIRRNMRNIVAINSGFRMSRATTFDKISLLLMAPIDGMKLPITTHMKTVLASLESWSVWPGIGSDISTGNFIATANTVREAAFSAKNLHGNQSLFTRKAWKASAAIARIQSRDAAAT
uniref:Uncharacterized protein n=1 Tax=Solanum lycopersicum TaxID=4081 RepID=A0A3Q7IP18_SOLLC